MARRERAERRRRRSRRRIVLICAAIVGLTCLAYRPPAGTTPVRVPASEKFSGEKPWR